MMNLDEVKKRLQNLQNKSNTKSWIWKPKEGENNIRIIPYVHNKSFPFNELRFHYEIGSRPYLSPVSVGSADPVVELAEQLKKTGDKENYQLARKLEPKMRTYVPIIDRNEEEKGVQFWGFGKTVYEDLLGVIADPDYGDITDPKTGRDITVTFIPTEKSGKNFPVTTIRMKPNQTPVVTDPELFKKIMDQPKLIGDVFELPSYDELKDLLNAWINPEQQGADSTPKSGADDLPWETDDENTTVKDSAAAPSIGDIDEAFAKVMKGENL